MLADMGLDLLIDPAAPVRMTTGELVAMLEAMGRVVEAQSPKHARRIFREWGKLQDFHRAIPVQTTERHDPSPA
jgi:hypothetical protein